MSFDVKILDSIHQISPQDWNKVCTIHYPFIRHEFLAALEDSHCTSAATGWIPYHLCIFQQHTLICIMPMYQKTNSNGEYVFDWDWADAYARNEISYYPKLLTAIPFSPCYGPRIASLIPIEELLPTIFNTIRSLCDEQGFSSWHGLFIPKQQIPALEQQKLLTRQGLQYHWHNDNYLNFEHYLASFTSRKRKGIKRERRKVKEQNVCISAVEGPQVDNVLLREFYHCYHLTYLKRGRQGYLNEVFFKNLLNSIPEQIVLFIATHEGKTVACAWCFKNTSTENSTLYGRYWGCLEDFDNLHFETCYYQGLEYCIEHNIQRFDPGAQGEHKISRGFAPITTYSSHYIQHPQFRDAIADFLERETSAIGEHKLQLNSLLPFKDKAQCSDIKPV